MSEVSPGGSPCVDDSRQELRAFCVRGCAAAVRCPFRRYVFIDTSALSLRLAIATVSYRRCWDTLVVSFDLRSVKTWIQWFWQQTVCRFNGRDCGSFGGLKMQDRKMEDQKMEDRKLQDQVLAWKIQE